MKHRHPAIQKPRQWFGKISPPPKKNSDMNNLYQQILDWWFECIVTEKIGWVMWFCIIVDSLHQWNACSRSNGYRTTAWFLPTEAASSDDGWRVRCFFPSEGESSIDRRTFPMIKGQDNTDETTHRRVCWDEGNYLSSSWWVMKFHRIFSPTLNYSWSNFFLSAAWSALRELLWKRNFLFC